METPDLTPALTPQQKYRQSEKCKISRDKYYQTKGKVTAHEYYMTNRERILENSKIRYAQLKGMLDQVNVDLENDLT